MKLDILAKLQHFGIITFFGTLTPGEFYWPEVIQIVACQYRTKLSADDVKQMDWKTKAMWLKRSPVTIAQQIDYIFRQVFGKVIFSGMDPIWKVLNFDAKNEYQNRGPQHSHVYVHVYGAPEIDVDPDITVKNLIEKYVTYSLPCRKTYPKLVKTLQTHNHTFTCRKKKGCKCQFNYPCPPSEDTIIVRG